MRVIDIEDVVYAMRNQTQFVLRCEEVFHDKISSAAAAILSAQPRKPFVCLTGPSGSGKTTTAMRLQAYLENLGVKVCLLSMDNFFLPLSERPKDLTDWESPLCVNRELLLDTIDRLSNGETVQVPWYDFPNNRTGGYTPMQGSREAVIIAEGIHMLNPLLFDPIRDRATGIYVAPRTRIITSGDRIIHPEQVRVARRMIRNYQGRGNSLRDTILRAESVNAGEQKYIAPNKPNASIHIDSFHDYELCILAKYLRQIPQFASDLDDAFIAEHGLTVLMDVVRSLPPLDTPYVPRDSIVREFVGGSISNTDTKENTHMTVVERFLKLVSYPTTSDEASETCPSTARQLALAQELVRQMQDMGIADAHVDQDGYVYGTVPANCDKKIPVYGLIAHMDTSPDAPGENIRARITEPYDGGDIVLNEEKHIMLSPKEYPQLKNSVGKRLIVTDGTTLLGADDKAAWRRSCPPRSCCLHPKSRMEPSNSPLRPTRRSDAGPTGLM